MTRVKICGITNEEDALKAVYYGADALGFIFYKKSPRYVSPSKARKIIERLPPYVTPVGVFVNHKERALRDVCRFTRIQTIQFHGDEDAVFCKRFKDFKLIKAFRMGLDFNMVKVRKYKVDAYLFDAYQDELYGGTGKVFKWDILKNEKIEKPFIVSGGLTPENVADGIKTLKPFAVDVASGVERSPGIKDPQKIRTFFESVRSV